MNSFLEGATAVLVHAAWADASSWNKVILPLRNQGLQVISVQIPLTSLNDDVTVLRRALERANGPVVLVGHSYAGAVITGAAAQEDRVKALVYVAAMAPDEGETVGQLFYRAEPHPEAPRLEPDGHNFIWMSEQGFTNGVAPEASADEAAVMAATQRPISIQCLGEPVTAPAWKTKPSWFLLAEQDRMISPATQRFMAERMGAHLRPHPVDHTPLLSAPDVVVDVILEAARATLS